MDTIVIYQNAARQFIATCKADWRILLPILVGGILAGRALDFPIDSDPVGWAVELFLVLLSPVLYGLMHFRVILVTHSQVAGGESGNLSPFRNRRFWSYFWVRLLYGLWVMVGLATFLIPGIIWYITYAFVGFNVLFSNDFKRGKKGAFEESKEMTSGKKVALLSIFWPAILIVLGSIVYEIVLEMGKIPFSPVEILFDLFLWFFAAFYTVVFYFTYIELKGQMKK